MFRKRFILYSGDMHYEKGYKYQVVNKDFNIQLNTIKPTKTTVTEHLKFTHDGFLTVRKGFAWDGPSGPTFDTDNFMAASLVHDVLYKLMRIKAIPCTKENKYQADRILQELCKEAGMNSLRAWWVFVGVDKFGYSSTLPINKKKTYKVCF